MSALRTRDQLEAMERLTLAPYAQFSCQTRGRRHPEPPPEWRTHFQRDRDRVVHSRAFRRLEGKTQVFLNGTGDHLRTRLTHTMEVAAIARNIARALRLNEDLAETIALAHDLGHPPFGHKGETVLNRLMREHGGFEHNRQSLRIVEELEQKYPQFPGLNLTWEVREGLVCHSPEKADDKNAAEFSRGWGSLEAQVANLADEIAYYSHDLDDGLESGLLQEKALMREVELFALAARQVKRAHGQLPDECRRFFIIRCVIDLQVRDVVTTSAACIAAARLQTADDARACRHPLIRYSPARHRQNRELRRYLYRNLYYNPVVHQPNRRAVKMLAELFRYYLQHPQEIGEQSRKRAAVDGWPRAICDYLSGMTDRYALLDYEHRLQGRPTSARPQD
ncbi:deoxyguanosinetriphosphate triphosphohydrolase [Fontisphaera persica]|uniref:deoxyguanosinetriphosphate triphosphohydrolase n=1 Tax=Fontisphaera persica TaxID=2974023 RepID=UPI0024BF9200|nr:deoxyguanosinetriphosphate triphosphohydrolase [Fontisphaera persica]WCJ60417.1 deoxyguanosinetriphosphate triphosphohydrolase [Fontisphaera persica]